MKKVISRFDLFAASPVLRANGQQQVVNLCGSMFSICIFAVFCFIFFSNIVSITKLQNISSTQVLQSKSDSNQRISNITFAFGLQKINLLNLRDIFQVRASIVDKFDSQVAVLSAFPCTREIWGDLDETKYKTLRLETYLCFQRNGFQIYGQDNSASVNMVYLKFSLCSNLTSPVQCKTPAEINTFFTTQTPIGQHFACSLAILDTGLNAVNQNPYIFSVYEETLWMVFNVQQQILAQVYLGKYQVNTDTNFLPLVTTETKTGYFIYSKIITPMVNYRNVPAIAHIYLSAKPVKKVVNRQFGKFDSVLSYVGGLYGIVISFFAFFMMSFNQYKYELRVSEGAFSFSEGHLAREKDLHFGKYVKYVAYDWIKTLFCCQLDWNECKAIDEARAEANEQIDVKHLLKRISHLQNVIQVISNPQISNAICLIATSPIQTVQKKRNLLNYCQRISSQKIRSLTICDLQNMQLNQQSSIIMGESVNEKINNYSNSFINFNKTEMTEINIQSVPNKNSFQLIDEFVKKFKQKFTIENQVMELSQSQLTAEQELVQSFSSLKENQRIKIVKKITLGILCRFNQYFCKGKRDCKIVENQYREDKNGGTGKVKEIQMGLGELRVRKNGKIRSNLVRNTKV